MHYLLLIFIFSKLPFFFFFFPSLCLPLLCRSTPLSPFPSSFDFRVGGFAWIFSEIKQGRIFPENEMGGRKKSNFFLFSLGFCMDFLGNQTENEWGRKKKQFFCFPQGFAWIFSEIKRKINGGGKKAIFFVFLRVLHEFSRKSNKDEFSQKMKGGRRRRQIQKTQGAKEKAIFLVFLGGGFSRKSNEDEFSRKRMGGTGEQKKK